MKMDEIIGKIQDSVKKENFGEPIKKDRVIQELTKRIKKLENTLNERNKSCQGIL